MQPQPTVSTPPQQALRHPDTVMRLARMGASFPTRLSFMRSLLRRMAAEQVAVTRPVWEINAAGYGRAVYSLTLSGHTYSLVAFSTELADEDRTDRVIAQAWDSSYVLFDGIPTTADLDRLQENAPRQEAGRFEETELVLSRANKSVRLFAHVVDSLASGQQPDPDIVSATGYLMRTTAVYGNGKFGIADRGVFLDRPALSGPFQAEMLTVWLIRGFTHDLVNHIAACRAPDRAVPLAPEFRRALGIGNSTGLGMAPFLVSHPVLMNNWILVRETALARVRALEMTSEDISTYCISLIERVAQHLDQWFVPDRHHMARIEALRQDWRALRHVVTPNWLLGEAYPWDRLIHLSNQWDLDCQELVVALVLEPHGKLVDGLTDCMDSTDAPRLDPTMTVGILRGLLRDHFGWALDIDFQDPAATRQFWYVSEEKLEPRLGLREEERGADKELPLDIARKVQALNMDLQQLPQDQLIAEFLLAHPDHRYCLRRVQTLAKYPYSEIRDNLIAETCQPIDMLRCKLACFGAAKFYPKSDRWTRITMYQGAPLAEEVQSGSSLCDDWWLPVLALGR
ncbi:MAG: hypothetical protein P1V34_09960 [Alphaproteobacteria bacterium]|nr:hypothetical protein [Alphaproteobacteria bacterium]